ncbi:MAG: hypothetical protein ACLUEK_06345 [Oscillospiraceae bacterium]
MSKVFKGRAIVAGSCTAPALVSHGGFNTLASFQMAMMFGDKKCGDQNNPDLTKAQRRAAALSWTIAPPPAWCSTPPAPRQPACALFSMTIDSLVASAIRRQPGGRKHARRRSAQDAPQKTMTACITVSPTALSPE